MSYYDELVAAPSVHAANALVFGWLSDDDRRAELFAELRQKKPVLSLQSRAKRVIQTVVNGVVENQIVDQDVFILTRAADIETALKDYSNQPYKAIGSGTFVLALDNNGGRPDGHEAKRDLLENGFRQSANPVLIHALAAQATFHAMIGPCKTESIDVQDIAEQAALRFVSAFAGIPDKDHFLLQETMRATYQGMITQMYARHFVTEPLLVEGGKAAMGKLAQRVGELIAESDFVKLTADVFDVLQKDPAQAAKFMTDIARAALDVEPGIKDEVTELVDKIAKGSPLSHPVAKFLDGILNAKEIRKRLKLIVAKVCGQSLGFRDAMHKLVDRVIDKKVGPEDRLIPRRFTLVDGKPVPVVPESGEKDADFKKRIQEIDLKFRPTLIEVMARDPDAFSGSEAAVAVVGTIAGLMGNVIAGVCIALKQYFKLDDEQARLKSLAGGPMVLSPAGTEAATKASLLLVPFVRESLRLNPPAAFVPRFTKERVRIPVGDRFEEIPANSEVLIPLGAATLDPAAVDLPNKYLEGRPDKEYLLMFGHPSNTPMSHRCIGEHVAIALISQVVRGILALKELKLPDAEEQLIPLTKKWGYICEKFPLTYARAKTIVHQPLNVVMKIRAPVGEHAEALKKIIKYAAPSIEQLLVGSKIVHTARFVFLNGDTELGLFTVYDGEFKPYIEHFGQVAGRLFDRLFEHIEQPPPMPVRENINEFVEHIRRFDLPSAENYFFSAHPDKKV